MRIAVEQDFEKQAGGHSTFILNKLAETLSQSLTPFDATKPVRVKVFLDLEQDA